MIPEMVSGGWRHFLSFAVRFNNHFTGAPVESELPVRLDSTFIRPVKSADGRYRHDDGTYRFINLDAGIHRVRWLPALVDDFDGWVSWGSDPLVHLPLADPADLIQRDLWPLASAKVTAGTTAVRGRLIGSNNADQRVSIAHPAIASTRFTFSDDIGDFLFLLPESLATNNLGELSLSIEVESGARTVDGGYFVPGTSGTAFVGSQFLVLPGKTSRVDFEIS